MIDPSMPFATTIVTPSGERTKCADVRSIGMFASRMLRTSSVGMPASASSTDFIVATVPIGAFKRSFPSVPEVAELKPTRATVRSAASATSSMRLHRL